jgi:hypothetical protein
MNSIRVWKTWAGFGCVASLVSVLSSPGQSDGHSVVDGKAAGSVEWLWSAIQTAVRIWNLD